MDYMLLGEIVLEKYGIYRLEHIADVWDILSKAMGSNMI